MTAGRPAFQPTDKDRRTVEVLAGFGLPQDKIAIVLGIGKMTLWRYFRTELDRGSATVEATLVGNLLTIAKGKDAVALKAIIFALQARFGWSFLTPINPPPPGKKESAVIEAQTAHEESDWGRLVN